MLGAIFGDIIGSTRELHNVKTFPPGSHFTDDTVMTVAVAEKLLNANSGCNSRKAYAARYKQYYSRYRNAGFGQMFSKWAENDTLRIQRSYGNGAAMRVTAIGYAFDDLKPLLKEVKASCYYTHHNREAIKGAKAVATCVFLARKQEDKDSIKRTIEKMYGYRFQPLDEIRRDYVFDSRASYSVPPALEAFFESDSYEITGGIAEAYYREIPKEIATKGNLLIDSGLRRVVREFNEVMNVE